MVVNSAPPHSDGDPFKLLKFLMSPPPNFPFSDSKLINSILFGDVLFYRIWSKRKTALFADECRNRSFPFPLLMENMRNIWDLDKRSLLKDYRLSIERVGRVISTRMPTPFTFAQMRPGDNKGSSISGVASNQGTPLLGWFQSIHASSSPTQAEAHAIRTIALLKNTVRLASPFSFMYNP